MIALTHEARANAIFEELLAQGIVVRPLKAFGLPQCLRISTGSEEANQKCVEAMQKAVSMARV